ncbi:MAG: response regulator transcription factor [Bacteroidetes bacterium]|nr:response regulator transcription factor [Bacteroidota bacterium]
MKNVLIANANKQSIENLKTILEHDGFVVQYAFGSFSQMLAILDKSLIEILIVDQTLLSDQLASSFIIDLRKNFNLPIVVTGSENDSASMERIVALQPHGYIAKPFKLGAVRLAIDLALVKFKESGYHNYPNRFFKDSFFVKSGHAFVRVRFEDILYLEADSGYTVVHTMHKKIIDRRLLVEFENELSPEKFLRIHRSFIVSVKYVDVLKGNEISINGETLPIGRTYKQGIMQLIEKN